MDRPVDEIPVEAMARFTAAEARLYPMALTDPAGYELVTSLVGLVADELRRSSADIASVLERRSELIGLVPRLAAEAGLARWRVPPRPWSTPRRPCACRELGAAG